MGSLKTLLTGSNNQFDYRNPGMNGKTDTVETLGSNLSIKIRGDSPISNKRNMHENKRHSKFSPSLKSQTKNNVFFANAPISNEKIAANNSIDKNDEIPSERKLVKSSRKSDYNNEIYKKVLMNNALPGKKKISTEEIKEIEMTTERKYI